MEWFKRNPFFYSILCLLLAATFGGMWYASQDREELALLKDQYDSKNQQLQFFLKRSPAPTKANLERLNDNYSELLETLRRAQASLNLNTYDRDLFFGQAPRSHNDAFFMIAKYVEDARNLAISSGVTVSEDSRYGFSEYENVGPDKKVIERVHRQAKIMEALLLALFDSGICEFVSIKRESSIPVQGGRAAHADLFDFNRSRMIGVSDVFDSLAFQLEFKGQSLSLRSFLNRITSSSLPFSISEIEVKLDRETGSGESRRLILDNPFAPSGARGNAMPAVRVPIIAENESYFVVTLGFLELAEESIAVWIENPEERRPGA